MNGWETHACAMVTSSRTENFRHDVFHRMFTFHLLNSIVFDNLRFTHDFHGIDLFILNCTNFNHISKCTSSDDVNYLKYFLRKKEQTSKRNDRFTSKSASVIFPLMANSGKNIASCPRTGKFVLDRR